MTVLYSLSRLFLGVLAALGMLTSAVSAAQAHDQLTSAVPAANESLAVAPEAVVLEFNNDILDTGSVILVTNVNGESVTSGALSVDTRTVTQALLPNIPNGQYRVVWRVVSKDGHPIEDSYQFAVGEPLGPFEPTVEPAPVPEETVDAEPESPIEVTSAAAEPEQSDSTLARIGLIALIGAGIGAGVYAVFALRRKRTGSATPSETKD